MLAKYGLKAVEYLSYALAVLVALPLIVPDLLPQSAPNDLAAVVFVLLGVGVLLPRVIAYFWWLRVPAHVGPYRGTWDGEQSAGYTYKVGNQQYARSFRTIYGTDQMTRLQVCVNPRAPWVGYPVFWNVWLFGATMVGLGLFLLVSGVQFFN
ncbi:hypothetical protein [Yoonia vestfoldensis]|uniref:hypothetical protein n=1 Tax=Yoonia vestfoldensis TaxID=245188 RepID=UPI0003802A6C|nr:hypothetical protein [Yoonia vestfoldensis]